MARIPLGDQVSVGLAVANVDAKYGPHSSVQAAFEALGEDGDDVLAVGLTIGVTQSDGSVKEYWIKKKAGSDFSASDFVEKVGVSNVSLSEESDADGFKLKVTLNGSVNGEVNIPAASSVRMGMMTPNQLASIPSSISVPSSMWTSDTLVNDSAYADKTDIFVTE